jgi:protein SCO1/2
MRRIAKVCIWLVCLTGFSCATGIRSDKAEESLPFFNRPDWTPEWIRKGESGYDSIHTIPPFTFTDQYGRPFTERDLDGRIHVASFFFTRCRSVCPRMNGNLLELRRMLRDERRVLMVSFSVDPDNDSVPVLRRYAVDMGMDSAGWRLITGDREAIYRLAKREYFAGDSIGYAEPLETFLHTENLVLVDGRRRIRGVYNGTLRTEVGRMEEDIRILLREWHPD